MHCLTAWGRRTVELLQGTGHCHVMRGAVLSCVVVWCHVLWCHMVWCGVLGYRAIGLAICFVEQWVGCVFELACCYVGLSGKLGFSRGLLSV